jgi:hypothetical protein
MAYRSARKLYNGCSTTYPIYRNCSDIAVDVDVDDEYMYIINIDVNIHTDVRSNLIINVTITNTIAITIIIKGLTHWTSKTVRECTEIADSPQGSPPAADYVCCEARRRTCRKCETGTEELCEIKW